MGAAESRPASLAGDGHTGILTVVTAGPSSPPSGPTAAAAATSAGAPTASAAADDDAALLARVRALALGAPLLGLDPPAPAGGAMPGQAGAGIGDLQGVAQSNVARGKIYDVAA